jgi:hypothetical protein
MTQPHGPGEAVDLITFLQGLAGLLRAGTPASHITDDEDAAAAAGALAAWQVASETPCPHCGKRPGERTSRRLTNSEAFQLAFIGHVK